MLTSTSRPESENGDPAKGPLAILLVEDEPTLAVATAAALRERGHRVVLATTAAKAFADLTEQSFDVILLDLQLGEDRGENLIFRLRAAGYDVPPIVVVSAKPTAVIQTVVKVIGAAAFVQKPCKVDEIQAVLNRVVA